MIWRGGIGVVSRRLHFLRLVQGLLFARTPGHGACSPWHWAHEACQTFLGAGEVVTQPAWRYTNLRSGGDHREPEVLTTGPEGLGPFTQEGSLLELSPVDGVMNAGGIARPRANFWCRPAAVGYHAHSYEGARPSWGARHPDRRRSVAGRSFLA